MWIVMTSCAAMPSSCKGTYRRVAIVQLTQKYTARNLRPKMISARARGVVRLMDLGHHNVGKTPRAAYQRTLAEAEKRAYQLNNTAPADAGELMSWGGSA